MSLPTVEGIKTIDQLRAEQSRPVDQELDRNAFLRLFTTQLQNQNPLDPMKNEAFVGEPLHTLFGAFRCPKVFISHWFGKVC